MGGPYVITLARSHPQHAARGILPYRPERVARSGSPSSARSEGSWSSDGSGDRKSKPTKPKYGVREGSLTGVTKTWGVLGGFSLATETRFPIVTKSQEEIDAYYARGSANAK